jgi:hypothetical protein
MKHGQISARDTAYDAERRAFLRTITAVTTAALATGACSSSVGPVANGSTAPGPGPGPIGGTNLPPVWQTVPTITFTQGVASSVSIGGYVSDPNGNALTVTLQAGGPALPTGVTYDPVGMRFIYNGGGTVGSTSGYVLSADDGQP